MAEQVIYKPKLEFKYLEQNFKIASEEYFEKLTKEGKVDVEANKLHVSEYQTQLAKIKALEKKLNGSKGLKGFLIFSIVVLFLAAIILTIVPFFSDISKLWFLFLIAGVCLLGGIGLIIFIVKKINKKIAYQEQLLDKERKESARLLQICFDDLAGINSLFDWGIAGKIMNKVTPIIHIDEYFDNSRMYDLIHNFGFPTYKNDNETVLGITSGHVQGNPFALVKSRIRTIGPKTYHGSLVISWVTYSTDSKGNTITHHHTQTLHASVTKPCPYFTTITKLHYGSEVSPKLNFSRSPTHGDLLSEKEREKAIKKGTKEIQKKSEKAIKEGKTFTAMGNEAFDVFFKALNRNDEVQFRLMFSPLAQQNMLALILDKEPYGDDFTFIKNGTLNTIIARHNQSFNYNISPDKYRGFDYETMKEFFLDYVQEFCRSLYFSFAPILSIPMYQVHKPHDFIYKNEENTNISYIEQEIMANALGEDYFRPKEASVDVPVTIKYESSSKVGNGDSVTLTSSSYKKIPHVEIVPKMGGDGHMHGVPVEWIEYIEVNDEKNMGVTRVNASHLDYLSKKDAISNNSNINGVSHFERGLFSLGVFDRYTKNMDDGINSLFKKENE